MQNHLIAKFAPASIVLSGVLWGCAGLFVRPFQAMGFASLELVFFRALFTVLVLGPVLAATKPAALKVKWKDLWCFAGTGLISFTLFNYTLFETIRRTSLSVATILMYTAPVFVMVLSIWLFGEKLTKRKVLSMLLALVGLVLVSGVVTGFSGGMTPVALLLGLVTGLGYGLYSIFSRCALNRGYAPITITFYTFVFSLPATLLLVDLPGLWQKLCSRPGAQTDFGRSMPGLLLLFFAFALCTTILPYLLYTGGLPYVENTRATLLAAIEPCVATLCGLVVFHELPGALQWMGMALILVAVVMLALSGKPPCPEKPDLSGKA